MKGKRIIAGLAICMYLGLFSCTNESASKESLRKAGYSDIETNGYDWFGCSEDDFYHTKFTAKNPRGEIVDGTVCCGFIFKNCTIRF